MLVRAASAVCFICGVASERHQPCAVCHSTNAHTRVCSFCRAQHRVLGIDWSEDDIPVDGGGDVGSDERRALTLPFAEIVGRRRRRGPRALKAPLIDAALIVRERRVRVQRIDDRGRARGWYERIEIPSRRAIARQVGCSHTYVNRRFWRYIRARLSRSSTEDV